MQLLVSIGIMAYNEEKNISHLLDSILNQKLNSRLIKEIIVISSGSADQTNKIVKQYANKNKNNQAVREKVL